MPITTPVLDEHRFHQESTMIACPRHGALDVAADAPCPDCSVAAYDLSDRTARDLVRANRDLALKTRKNVAGVVIFGVTVIASLYLLPVRIVFFNINVLAFLVAGAAASFGARPLALRLETAPRLRRLDNELHRQRI
jgi:hypothetical protein